MKKIGTFREVDPSRPFSSMRRSVGPRDGIPTQFSRDLEIDYLDVEKAAEVIRDLTALLDRFEVR